jgi:Holliday junction DNA helicase RuvA
MIAKLAGLVDGVAEESCIIDVGGVGYLVFCSARTLRALPRPGEAVKLLVETHVREDHIHLYGFATEAEKRWFGLLQTVQGVGAKLALAILSGLGPDDLTQAIGSGDKARLTAAPGVGPKLATRLATELKDKAGQVFGSAASPAAAAAAAAPGGVAEDAVSALVNLGYRRAEAFSAVLRVARELGEGATVQKLITAGLKELAK